jgi:hypothetical protein
MPDHIGVRGNIVKYRIWPLALVLATSALLTACRSADELTADAVAQQKAICAAKGKQFLWHDTDREQGIFVETVRVEGKCVGPGEKGFQKPVPEDNSP